MTRTMKNTLKSVLVLFVISAVSVALLAVANNFLRVIPALDMPRARLINSIASTGYSDDEAYAGQHIVMLNIDSGEYPITSLKKYNKQNGKGAQVVAVYYSENKDTKVKTLVLEVTSEGYSGEIVNLVAFDKENKISGIVNMSNSESFWGHIKDLDGYYASFIGKSGGITADSIKADSGATVRYTNGAFAVGVNFACRFATDFQAGEANENGVKTMSISEEGRYGY